MEAVSLAPLGWRSLFRAGCSINGACHYLGYFCALQRGAENGAMLATVKTSPNVD